MSGLTKPKRGLFIRMLNIDEPPNGNLRYKKVIPHDLRRFFTSPDKLFGQTAIIESLGTKDERTADRKAEPLRQRDNALFAGLRLLMKKSDRLTPEERMLKAEALVHQTMDLVEENKEEGHDEEIAKRMAEDFIIDRARFPSYMAWRARATRDAEFEVNQTAIDIVQGKQKPSSASEIKIKKCLSLFLEDSKGKGRGKRSESSWRKFETDRIKAVDSLIEVIGGDKNIHLVTRDHVRLLKAELQKQELATSTINVKLSMLQAIFSHGFLESDSDKRNPFEKMRDADQIASNKKRKSFTADQVKHVLSVLDEEPKADIRAIGFLTVLSGCRMAEIGGLDASDIRLQDETPHMVIQPNDHRTLKTKASERTIPLNDNAIDVIQRLPRSGALFPRYMSQKYAFDNISKDMNKFLREKAGITDEKLVWHSFRHTMKDRLKNTGASIQLQNDILGHAQEGMSDTYGEAMALKHKNEALKKALEPYFLENKA